MVAAMDKVGVDGAIFISAFSMYRYDGSYTVEVQQAYPGRFAIIKPVDPDDPAVTDVIAHWKKTPGAVGIRIMLTKEAKREPNDPGLDRVLRAAVRHDFPVNILFWGNLDAGTVLVDRHPGTRFIIDYLGTTQPPAPPQPWADPNAVIKVSGACTLSRGAVSFPGYLGPLARVLDAWGFDRCLWGTDWTRALPHGRHFRWSGNRKFESLALRHLPTQKKIWRAASLGTLLMSGASPPNSAYPATKSVGGRVSSRMAQRRDVSGPYRSRVLTGEFRRWTAHSREPTMAWQPEASQSACGAGSVVDQPDK
jgi:L-fuconolactonase